MQIVTVDLAKNPDIKNLTADMEPGDRLALYGSIKSLDDQTLVVTVDEADEDREPEEKEEDEDAEVGNEGAGDVGGTADELADELATD